MILIFSIVGNTNTVYETVPINKQSVKNIISNTRQTRYPKKTDDYRLIYYLIKYYNPKLSADKAKVYATTIYFKSREYNVDPYWILAMILQESSLNAKAQSKKGAIGLMQLMPSTARAIGVSRSALYNPRTNIIAGIKYFAYLKQYYKGDIKKATIAYNQGLTRVNKGKYNSKYYYKIQKHYREIKKRSVDYDLLQKRDY